MKPKNSSQTSLRQWLEARGFKDNPFAKQEASSEDLSLLNEYFVAPPYFDEFVGRASSPRTAFLFAPRGGGKTAFRRMIEHLCRQSFSGAENVLAASFTDFAGLIEAAGSTFSAITPRLYVDFILREVVAALVNQLQENPSLLHQIKELAPPDQIHLQWYLFTYGHHLKTHHLSFLRQRLGFTTRVLGEATGRLGFIREAEEQSPASPDISLETLYLLEGKRGLSPAHLLAEFMDLLGLLGIKALYVLVDGVDECPETAYDFQAGAVLLRPLVGTLSLMNMRRVAFKFFLPTEMQAAVLSPEMSALRPDRVLIRSIEWDEKSLLEVLSQRLLAFSEGRISTLDVVSRPELRGRIDRELVRLAQGSPRNMLRLGELLLSEHCRRPITVEMDLDEESWQRARQKFSRELALRRGEVTIAPPAPAIPPMGIWVDEESGRVYVDGELLALPLTGQPYRLLLFLFQRRGQICTRRQIYRLLWGGEYDAATDKDVLDRVVSRLRKRLGRGKRYLRTVRGRGYLLEVATE